jgi:Type IV secretion-system coupling protein DNA-binding domain
MFRTLSKWLRSLRARARAGSRLVFGQVVCDDEVTRNPFSIAQERRTEHIAVLGKTGTGKSSLLRSLCSQDITSDRGFVFFDLHGDATEYLLRRVALEEKRRRCDLSEKLIVIDPADEMWSVGVNVLECAGERSTFVQIAEFAALLRHRWHLDSLGARTEELLRNSLYALAESHFTLLELAPFLIDPGFRALCLRNLSNVDIRKYFEDRYDKLSDGMRTMVREPILNKTSALTTDPQFRHIVGQRSSTLSLRDAMERGCWVVLNLNKGRLGEESVTLGSLFLGMVKNALFSRQSRRLLTLYCDEIQNLVTYDSGLDTILSESRKFGTSVVSANQFLDQYPQKMRAAILAVGTQAFFQLTSSDAQHIAAALNGGLPLAELLKNSPKRHLVVKSGSDPWQEVHTAKVDEMHGSYTNLYDRCRNRWARKRSDIEEEIESRHANCERSGNEVLSGWT